MHWYIYNNTIPLLSIAKTQIFHLVYNFKNLDLTLFHLPASQPASLLARQPAVRPNSTIAMAPDFSHKKGYHV